MIRFRIAVGRIGGRRLDRRGQRRALHERQFPDIHAEIRARRGLYAVRAPAEVHRVEIHLKDFILGVGTLDLKSEVDLLKLTAYRRFCA